MSARIIADRIWSGIMAVWPPLACLALGCIVWTALARAIGVVSGHLPARTQLVANVVAGVGAVVLLGWLAVRVRRALKQSHWDQEAAQMLDVLRLEATQQGSVLLEIHQVQWTARSGQRVWAVDVLTGEVSDRWVPGEGCLRGSVVLMRNRPGRSPNVIARMRPEDLDAANRYRDALVARNVSPGHLVVEAAEQLLRDS